jgi:aminoglycoside phosphotransferase (APT) family kinase protein
MPPITNQKLNARREENCVAITTERKYFKVGQSWVKRSLRPSEWQINPMSGTILVPRFGMERIFNEAAAMEFIAKNTNIPVPKLYSCFEDDEAAYLVMEYVEGITLNHLDIEKRKVIEKEVETYLETMRELKSSVWGGPSGIVSKYWPDLSSYSANLSR